jgi:mono/diheme cytochrome c family protein
MLRRPPPPLVETPEAIGWGRRLFEDRCLHCHSDVPLAPRVAGWSPERAYEAIGRLPELYASMPAFHGTDDERRALAVFVSAVGAGRARY